MTWIPGQQPARTALNLPTSNLTWLDFSESDQTRIREVLRLFEDRYTFDDLGIGPVRDTISDQLFPGTSTIQTRARYFLFIPWVFQEAERRWPTQMLDKAHLMERKLIGALKSSDDTKGLIGIDAGVNLQTLPSTIYWPAMAKFRILAAPNLTKRQYHRLAARSKQTDAFEGELSERSQTFWHRTLPPAPVDFFKFEQASFALTSDEADWLANRMSDAQNELGTTSLLHALADEARLGHSRPSAATPWDQGAPDSAPPEIVDLVEHAKHFSCLVEGGFLLYNLMLGERRLALGLEPNEATDPDTYAGALDEWSSKASSIGLAGWASDIPTFWDALPARRQQRDTSTRLFIETLAMAVSKGNYDLAKSDDLRAAVEERESSHKTSQSRFRNHSRLNTWAGGSGTTALTFRWDQVQRMIGDLHDGFASAGAS